MSPTLPLPVLIQLLRDKFRDFARETGAIGQDRVDNVNAIIERLIDAGHSEAATIAEWKDGLNEMWADLLELIDTRMQLLAASYDLHRYFYTGAEILGLIEEKHHELPEDVGLDASTAESFNRVHTAFERELHLLGVQVTVLRCPEQEEGQASPGFSRGTPRMGTGHPLLRGSGSFKEQQLSDIVLSPRVILEGPGAGGKRWGSMVP